MTGAALKRSAAPGGNRDGAEISSTRGDTAKHHLSPQKVPEPDLSRKARVMEWVEVYSRNGLSLVPVIPGDRTPFMANFTKRRKPLPRPVADAKFRQCFDQHGDAQVGLVTGAVSRLTVVDVDAKSPDALSAAHAHFGNTPLVVASPGGWHLYYRHNGERSPGGLKVDGWPVDIRGEGGMIILPPSLHWRGVSEYAWHRGNPDLLWSGGLPDLEPGSLADLTEPVNRAPDRLSRAGGLVTNGNRNAALFDHGCRLMRDASGQSLEQLTAALLAYRDERLDQSAEEFTDAEVSKVAGSVWSGFDPTKAAKGQHYAKVTGGDLDRVPRREWGPLGLLAWLRMQHPSTRPGGFAIDCGKVAAVIGGGVTAKAVLGWREKLTTWGLLDRLHRGTGRNNPNRYGFPERSEHGQSLMPAEVINVFSSPAPPQINHRRAQAAALAERLAVARQEQGLGVEPDLFARYLGACLNHRGGNWSTDEILAAMESRTPHVAPALADALGAVLDGLAQADLQEAG